MVLRDSLVAWALGCVLALCTYLACASASKQAQTAWPDWLSLGGVADDPGIAVAHRSLLLFQSLQPLRSTGAVTAAHDSWASKWMSEPASLPWNEIALELVAKYRVNPLRSSRRLALLHVAAYDAVREAERQRLPLAAQRLALHSAASSMLEYLFPLEAPGRFQALAAAAYAAHAAGKPAWLDRAWMLGQNAAARTVRRALQDGADAIWDPKDQPPVTPGRWVPTPPVWARFPVEPLAAQWRVWVPATRLLDSPPPIAYDTPEFWAEAREVLEVTRALTPKQKEIAEYWNLDAGSVTPAGIWNSKAADLVRKYRMDTPAAARLFAALNVAMADAMIAAWRVKYVHWTVRPVTVIQEKLDPKFQPLLITPAFPGYVSGHASLSAAAAEVLSSMIPAEARNVRSDAEEAAMSRLYGGIHFRSDNDEGLVLGRKVGEAVMKAMRPGAQAPAPRTPGASRVRKGGN